VAFPDVRLEPRSFIYDYPVEPFTEQRHRVICGFSTHFADAATHVPQEQPPFVLLDRDNPVSKVFGDY